MPIHGSFNLLDLSSIHLGRDCHREAWENRASFTSCNDVDVTIRARYGAAVRVPATALLYMQSYTYRFTSTHRRGDTTWWRAEIKGWHVWIISSNIFRKQFVEMKKKSFVSRERVWKRVVEIYRGLNLPEKPRLQRDIEVLVSFERIKLRGLSRLRSGQKSNERRTTSAIFVSSTREKPQNPLRFQATHLPRRISQPRRPGINQHQRSNFPTFPRTF